MDTKAWYKVARVKPQDSSCTVTNLIEGTDYLFRVYAENIEGMSKPLVLERPVRPRRPVGGCRSCKLQFYENVIHIRTSCMHVLIYSSQATTSIRSPQGQKDHR